DGIGRRWHVRTPGPGDEAAVEPERQVVEPLRARERIGIEVGDELVAGRPQALVPGDRQAAVVDRDQPASMPSSDRRGVVGRAVVDADDLDGRVVYRCRVTQEFVERL